MSAIEERAAAVAAVAVGGTGKDTGDSTQLPAGGVHPAQPFPHLPYADAVHAELTGAGLSPDVVETGVRAEGRYGEGPRELYIRAEWLPGHDDLAAPRDVGMALQWSHLAGWSLLFGQDLVSLAVFDELAAPAVLAEAVLEGAIHGAALTPHTPSGGGGRWVYALELDIALVAYDERHGGVL